jgi:hypothetical protein
MNFISHFFLDRGQASSLFFVGIATPDLLSVHDRKIKLKEFSVPIALHSVQSDSQKYFAAGVMRHFEGDRVFHSSPFFEKETMHLSRFLKSELPDHQIHRGFFVAHVLLELLLDKILINKFSYLLPTFYNHFEQHEIMEIVSLTEWITGTRIPAYDGFLKKFISNRYLSHYTDYEYVIYVLKRLLYKVGIRSHTYLTDPAFEDAIRTYEKGLAGRCLLAFEELSRKMAQVKLV